MPAPARASFGSLPGGTAVSRWTLTDATGASTSILDYGAIIQALMMRIETTEPGIQVYSCSHFDGTLIGTSGVAYPKYGGVALETQHYPDSPNRLEYPSTVLKPGDVYRSRTVLDFSLSGSAD